VDLCELEWDDRERVLRLLFAKMNAGVPPPLWRDSLPAIESKHANYEALKEELSQGAEGDLAHDPAAKPRNKPPVPLPRIHPA
jgi:hypothetical protein